MKNYLLLLLVCAVFTCLGCSPQEAGQKNEIEADSTTSQPLKENPPKNSKASEGVGSMGTLIRAEDILKLLIGKGLPIDETSIKEINANNDPEGLFGQPEMGIQKLAFKDSRYAGYECFIVIFNNFEDMRKEVDTVKALKNEGKLPLSSSCSYGVVTVRIPMEMLAVLTEYQDIFYGLNAAQVGEQPRY